MTASRFIIFDFFSLLFATSFLNNDQILFMTANFCKLNFVNESSIKKQSRRSISAATILIRDRNKNEDGKGEKAEVKNLMMHRKKCFGNSPANAYIFFALFFRSINRKSTK